jgi:CRP-like cAMP-binding protein
MTAIVAEAMISTALETDLLKGVEPDDVKELLSHPQVKQVILHKGQYIYHHGDVADKIWIIISGEIVAQVQSLRHPFHSLRYCPGDITGLRGIVDMGKPRPVSMIADSDVELYEIPSDVIMAMDVRVWGVMMANVAKILLDRLLMCHHQLDH